MTIFLVAAHLVSGTVRGNCCKWRILKRRPHGAGRCRDASFVGGGSFRTVGSMRLEAGPVVVWPDPTLGFRQDQFSLYVVEDISGVDSRARALQHDVMRCLESEA